MCHLYIAGVPLKDAKENLVLGQDQELTDI